MKTDHPYIFISYAHKDSAVVLPIIEGLRQRNFHVWYDTGIEAGTEWPEYIATKLIDSRCVIAFVSQNAMDSHNCRREINFAIARNKDLLVVYLEDLVLSPGMQMQLDVLQAMFYYRSPDLTTFLSSLEQAKLLQDCRSEIPACQPSAAPRLPEQPQQEVFQPVEPATEEPVAEVLIAEEPIAEVPMAEEPVEEVPVEEVPVIPEVISEPAAEPLSPTDPEQMYQLGLAYHAGNGVPKDPAAAVCWLEKAAQLDHIPAQNALAHCYEIGSGVPRDQSIAFKWYRKAATAGFAEAQANLGYYYQNGFGTPRNIGEAMRLYRAAAQQGNAKAQYCLGQCHETGNGAAVSIVEAVKWYRLAADQGYAPAQHSLALCYEKGSGLPRSSVQAAKYYQLAAEQGYAPAQVCLSRCYELGLGVPRNANEARKWKARSQT